MSSPPDEQDRQRLAAALRTLRASAELTTTQLAQRLGWSQSKVSKTELGQTRAKPADVAAWARATDADTDLRRDLEQLADDATSDYIQWRRDLAPGRRRVQEEIQRLEAEASTIRVFGMEVVPGLAQTEPYIAAMFRLGRPPPDPADLPAIVQARRQRQQALADERTSFVLLMSEMAVRRALLPADQMREQLNHLVDLSQRDNVSLGVIPFTARETVHQYHGYTILGDPDAGEESLVMTESLTRTLNIRAPDEVAQYLTHFDALRAAALQGEPFRAFLREVTADLAQR